MEQFSLEKYLENSSRKVVTRRGNPVRIICTDGKHGEDDLPIVFLEFNNGGVFLLTCRNDDRCDNYDTQYDLFFADEEEELTEFEKVLREVIEDGDYIEEESFDFWKDRLLDLARKEILKDLPKWKKVTDETNLSLKISNGDYYLTLEDLESLLEDSSVTFEGKELIEIAEHFYNLPKKGLWDADEVITWIALHAELYGGFNQGKLNSMCEDLRKAMKD